MTPVGRNLTPEAAAALDASPAVRRKLLRVPSLILHSTLETIVTRMDEALEDYPTNGDSYLLVLGDSGMGKSTLAQWYASQKGSPEPVDARAAQVDVLYVSLATASAKGFFGRILEKLNATYNASSSAEVLYPLVLRLLRRIGLKMLIIDEFHHAGDGPENRVTELLNYIKVLGNDLNITIAGYGVGKALSMIQKDQQIARRFELLPLNRWQLGGDYEALLDALEARLPLPRASNLSEPRTAEWILARAEGLTSAIDELIRLAATKAVVEDLPRIDLALLRSVVFIPPSKRSARAEAVLSQGRPG
jgi:type II secretory pathway predicted ATPase ExeA